MPSTADHNALLSGSLRRPLAWLAACSLGVAAQSCNQPKPFCIVSPAPFAVKLIEQDRQGDCDKFGPASFNANPTVGVAPYYERDAKGQPDYDHGSVAVQTAELGHLSRTAAKYGVKNSADDASLYSMGKFASPEPDDKNLCSVPSLSTTHLVLAQVPAVQDDPSTKDTDESFPGQPAQDVTLQWSNVKIVVSAAIFGSQVQADLSDTRVSANGATCTIKYRAVGLSPAVACYETDDKGNPVKNDTGAYKTDPTLCNPIADPSKGRYTGSGISPLADYTCDEASSYCVLRGDTVPASIPVSIAD